MCYLWNSESETFFFLVDMFPKTKSGTTGFKLTLLGDGSWYKLYTLQVGYILLHSNQKKNTGVCELPKLLRLLRQGSVSSTKMLTCSCQLDQAPRKQENRCSSINLNLVFQGSYCHPRHTHFMITQLPWELPRIESLSKDSQGELINLVNSWKPWWCTGPVHVWSPRYGKSVWSGQTSKGFSSIVGSKTWICLIIILTHPVALVLNAPSETMVQYDSYWLYTCVTI